jgi:hypothetical protein
MDAEAVLKHRVCNEQTSGEKKSQSKGVLIYYFFPAHMQIFRPIGHTFGSRRERDNRVVESWNQIPSDVKNARNVGMFKRLQYIEHTERPRPLQPRWREGWSTRWRHGERTLTLPERPQRGHWQFLYKYTSKYTAVLIG